MTTKVKQKPETPIKSIEPFSEASPVEFEPEAAPAVSWLTLETLLYILVLILGLSLRLWKLGSYPLSDVEAQQSLAAFQLYQANTIETVTAYSPLLVSLDTLIFFIFEASDATARLAPLLLGSMLILLPVTLRRHLGSPVCLLASTLLALSPTALFLSRTLNSEIGVAAGALMILSGFLNWAEDGGKRWLYLLAGGLAILLTAGAMAYSIIIIFALIILLRLARFKAFWRQGLARSEGARPRDRLAKDEEMQTRDDLQPRQGQSFNLPAQWRQAGLFFLATLFLLATTLTLNLSGFSVTTGLLRDWLSRFSFEPRLDASFNATFLLTIYEIVLVIAGLVGLAYAVLSQNLPRLIFAAWFIGALILDLIMAGRPTGNLMLSLLPLAFLAAMALAELWAGLQTEGSWGNEGIIMTSGLVIAIFGYIGLTGWLTIPCSPDDLYCNLTWLQAVAALLLFGVIVCFFWFVYGHGVALRGLALTGVSAGLIITINIAWRLNYGPLMRLAYQPLAGQPASTQLIELSETLANESMIRAGDKTLLDVALIRPTPALRWRLRAYQNLIQANSVAELQTPAAIISPASPEQELNLGGAYLGQDFAINAFWSPVGLQPKELINWLLYRQTNQQPQSDTVVLWLRMAEN